MPFLLHVWISPSPITFSVELNVSFFIAYSQHYISNIGLRHRDFFRQTVSMKGVFWFIPSISINTFGIILILYYILYLSDVCSPIMNWHILKYKECLYHTSICVWQMPCLVWISKCFYKLSQQMYHITVIK